MCRHMPQIPDRKRYFCGMCDVFSSPPDESQVHYQYFCRIGGPMRAPQGTRWINHKREHVPCP
jgi:hypothetical protein